MKNLETLKMIEVLLLQMYNPPEDNDGDGSGADGSDGNDGQGTVDGDQDKEVKTFTQDEMDKVVGREKAKAAAKAKKELEGSDDYKAYLAYLDNKKTEDEKTAEKLKGMSAVQDENASLKAELAGLKNKDALRGAKVDEEHLEFVMFEVNKMVSEDKTFGEALDEYKALENKAKYFGEDQQSNNSSVRTGQRHTKGGSGESGSRKEKMLNQLGYGKKPATKK